MANNANFKITKGEIDQTLQVGFTHARLTNNGVHKRMVKINAKHLRRQEIAANKKRLSDRALDKFLAAQPKAMLPEQIANPVEDFFKDVEQYD